MCKALNMKTETSQADDNSSNNTHSSPFENGQPTFNYSDAEVRAVDRVCLKFCCSQLTQHD